MKVKKEEVFETFEKFKSDRKSSKTKKFKFKNKKAYIETNKESKWN